MVVSYMKAQRCPKCGRVLDYFSTFNSSGKICRSCKWKKEIFLCPTVADTNGGSFEVNISNNTERKD